MTRAPQDLAIDNCLELLIPPEEVVRRGLGAMQSFLLAFHVAHTTKALELAELSLNLMPAIGHLEGLTSLVMLRCAAPAAP